MHVVFILALLPSIGKHSCHPLLSQEGRRSGKLQRCSHSTGWYLNFPVVEGWLNWKGIKLASWRVKLVSGVYVWTFPLGCNGVLFFFKNKTLFLKKRLAPFKCIKMGFNSCTDWKHSRLWGVCSAMCRYEQDRDEAVAYLNLQIHLESRKPSGMK